MDYVNQYKGRDTFDNIPWNMIAGGEIFESNKYDEEQRVMYLLSVFYCHNTDKDILSK